MEVVASLSQGHTAAAQCILFTHKSVLVIFEPPCIQLLKAALCVHIPALSGIVDATLSAETGS